jgi:Fe-S cluster biogenesis protein NfuA
MKEKVKKVIEELRPMLQADGGDIELVDVSSDGIVKVRLRGACAHCAGALMTLKRGVEARVKALVPEVKSVERVD